MPDRSWRTEGAVTLFIPADPDVVYEALADVTRTGERSPECHTAEWLPGSAPGHVGARFRGRNRSGAARWSRVCEVVAATPGREFAFRTVPERFDLSRRDSTIWRFRLEPVDGGTELTHSYEVTQMPLRLFRAVYGRLMPHHRDMRPQMQATIEALRDSLAPT
jgi:hypothetical protein